LSLLCVVEVAAPERSGPSFREVLPGVCECLIVCDLETSTVRRLGPSWAVAPQKKNVRHCHVCLYVQSLPLERKHCTLRYNAGALLRLLERQRVVLSRGLAVANKVATLLQQPQHIFCLNPCDGPMVPPENIQIRQFWVSEIVASLPQYNTLFQRGRRQES